MEFEKYLHPGVEHLWRLQPHEFNEWRARNDLPRLFAYLKSLLPKFDVWLQNLPFDMDVVLRIVPTADVFEGKSKQVVRRPDMMPGFSVVECHEGALEEVRSHYARRYETFEILGEIEPYFCWAKRTLGRRRFFVWDKINRYRTDGFIRGSCTGLDEPGCVTRAFLFRDYQLLKMGQIELGSRLGLAAVIGGKNLDFCDLDFLSISGGWHGYGSAWKTISYSSFRELSFDSADVSFYTFYKCWIDKLEISDSKLQDFYFDFTDIRELKVSGSVIDKLGFTQSNIVPFIHSTELRELSFVPKERVAPSIIARTYRMFRSAFQSNGLRQESSEYYYQERVYERKSYFHPYTFDPETFSGLVNGGKFTPVLDLYRKGFYQTSDLPAKLWSSLISKVKLHTYPRYVWPLAKYRFKWLVSMLESLLWGYGERPSRIIMVAFFVVSVYAGIYSTVEWVDADGKSFMLGKLDSLYFSLVTFTTLGYGDITPKTQLLKMLAGSEALCGAFIIGLIVAGFSNKSRY